MKILVIDDKKTNLQSATQTLEGHELTLCSSYDEAVALLEKSSWEAVLCDLLMPAGRDAQGPEGQKFIGVEMPVGWSLALVAASRGAKYVAVASDMNHHNHPASALLDRISQEVLAVNQAKVIFMNNVNTIGIKGTETGICKLCHGKEKNCFRCNGTGSEFGKWGKDWQKVLQRVIKYPPGEIGAEPGITRVF